MSRARGIEVVAVIALAVAAVGLFAGIDNSPRKGRDRATGTGLIAPADAANDARSYRDMRTGGHGVNARLSSGWWATLRGPGPDRFAVTAQTPADRAAALAARRQRRAYDGAPPQIPHAIDQLAVPACLSCHATGVTIGGLVAPVMSHPRHDSCVQCHVVSVDPRPGVTTPPAPPSTFLGQFGSGGGDRAWTGAPPVIPHPTWMRETCDACHGPRGRFGLRTPHPWQQSCSQCHAPSAALDQRPRQPVGAGR